MVKSGNVIEERILRTGKGYGRGGTWTMGETRLSGTVFYPEKPDGTIDRKRWCLTEKEAQFFEAVERDEVLNDLANQREESYKRTRERWNVLCNIFGVDRKY